MIAIDVGNTKTAVGLFRENSLVRSWSFPTIPDRPWAEYESLLGEFDSSYVIASVVPLVTAQLEMLRKHGDIHLVSHRSPLSFQLSVPHPEEVGADRLADMEAAIRLCGAPVVTINTGTATVLNVVDPQGRFLGGAIAPGVNLALDALTTHTAQLDVAELPIVQTSIGRNTKEALASGSVLGHAAMICELARRIRAEIEAPNAPLVVTGGAADLLRPYLTENVRWEPGLTLSGLSGIHQNLSR